MLLAVALLLSTLIPRMDGRFLEISKQPPGTVAIVPNDDDGESVLLGPVFEDLQELDREKASEMISVKLLNQYRANTFDVADQLNGNEMVLGDDHRSGSAGMDYGAVNRGLEGHGHEVPIVHPPSIDTDAIDMKENGIEQDFVPTEAILDKRLLDGWMPSDKHEVPTSENQFPPSTTVREGIARASKVDSMAAARTTTTTTTMTTTSTTTRTTTVRKMLRRIRQQLVSSTTQPPSSAQRTSSSRRPAIPVATTTTSQRPPAPKIDITKLNLDHLENDLLSLSTLVPPQALALASASSSARLLPRSIKPEEMVPACGCQHRKRSLSQNLYSSEEMLDPSEDYDDYDDYDDYNELQKLPASRSAADRPMLFPAMSRLLAAGSGELQEGSIERAEKVHGTLERLMGIVTIFSHVDEFIQRKTKQSIRRLARLYESEESD
ncbi:uncharacterized protein LOC118508495 [Anopheles stephensi]|uniref:uncharacterized protein LOC118508495 n=1 Tax=Anopheles stephensi TaxID=30069 RepID=UPI001658C16C|nr:uncharacterized protein LOC118508495 [Anopheles stephensi]